MPRDDIRSSSGAVGSTGVVVSSIGYEKLEAEIEFKIVARMKLPGISGSGDVQKPRLTMRPNWAE